MAAGCGPSRIPAAAPGSVSPCGWRPTRRRMRSRPMANERTTQDLVVHVVDDDIAVRRSLAFLFATAGIPARLHESALAFLEAAPDEAFGCILTDIRMPGMDGLELQRQLRQRGNT